MVHLWHSLTALLVTLLLGVVQSSKILIMPYHHKSHVNILANLAAALKDNGHEVWMLTLTKFQPMVERAALKPILFDVSPAADFNVRFEELMALNPNGEGVGDQVLADTLPGFGLFCDEVMTNDRVTKAINDARFDLAVVDGTMCMICMYMIPYKFDIPFITIHGFQVTSWDAGVTGMPSLEPEIETVYSNRMTFWERLDNLNVWYQTHNNPYSAAFSESHMAKYAGDKPRITFSEVVRKSEMFLVNFEILCLDYPRVSAPNYQYLGASTANMAKPLPQDLEKFVAGAEHGIVVMSLGSMKALQAVWAVIREKIFKAFGRLDQRVVIGYSLKGDVGKVPDNVRLLEWLPQNDLLGHPKTKLFVTHGGNNGQNEAVYHGIPMLVLPITIDQPYAGVRTESHNYGKYVRDKKAITSDELYDMMTEILHNDTYSANIKKCSAIVRSMPSAKERFSFWVNHILRFGGSHLRPPSLDMPLYQVLMLDIVAYYVVGGLCVVHAALFILYYVYTCCLASTKEKRA